MPSRTPSADALFVPSACHHHLADCLGIVLACRLFGAPVIHPDIVAHFHAIHSMLAVSAAEAPAVEAAPTEAPAEAAPGGAAEAAAKVAPAHRAVAEGLPAEVM